MDALGINPVALQTLPTQTRQSAPVLPKPQAAPSLPIGPGAGDASGFDAAKAEQKRFERVQRLARDVANVFVVSDRTFSIFKDATGQYVTRFRSLRDGRVTYIPEPELTRIGGGSTQTVNISA